ncbi:MAG: hypothetical protein O2931_11805 [Planctomycetota bacterium]|nr:hypothetical protein [Planctomycetota bacterium]MDA1179471.1 hypothetical protein [Planctomycetota bacterium]
MNAILRRAMLQKDDLVIVFDYTDSKGTASRRVVSPIRFLGQDRFLALCLCREEPRQFHLVRCSNMNLAWASGYTMPVEIMPVANRTAAAVTAEATSAETGTMAMAHAGNESWR